MRSAAPHHGAYGRPGLLGEPWLRAVMPLVGCADSALYAAKRAGRDRLIAA